MVLNSEMLILVSVAFPFGQIPHHLFVLVFITMAISLDINHPEKIYLSSGHSLCLFVPFHRVKWGWILGKSVGGGGMGPAAFLPLTCFRGVSIFLGSQGPACGGEASLPGQRAFCFLLASQQPLGLLLPLGSLRKECKA